MKSIFKSLLSFFFLILLIQCKKSENQENLVINKSQTTNQIQYANGFELYEYENYSVLKVVNPWPKATKSFTYILKKEKAIVPDSLSKYLQIQVPVKNVVATSTTHIASLTMLGVENTLIGFPNCDYISAPKVRKLINDGKVKELGNNQSINTEVAISLQPSVLIGYGLDNNNPSLDKLEKAGIKVVLNGDWNEHSPLGKAEWIKFFGALYGKQKEANAIFENVVKEYQKTQKLVRTRKYRPIILTGAMFEDLWFVPQGESWGAQFIKDAGGNYLWANEKGTGGLPLSFEKVFEKANKADFWIGPGQFNSLAEMSSSNAHYKQFLSFRNKQVYSYSLKKGATGGLIYFEDAPNRPDLVLKDLVAIFHPSLLPHYKPTFFQKLN